MNDTKKDQTRGRPRRFNPDKAVATAQNLFHARGYDAVSVADLTRAIGIKPPSFYAAFGNKIGLYARVLDRYAENGAIALTDLLRDDRRVADCLTDLLEEAAHQYGANPDAPGCLVLEGRRCDDAEARAAACAFYHGAEDRIRAFVARRHPQAADRVTDFVVTVMAGLSSSAREGHDAERLRTTARMAGKVLSENLVS